MALTRTQSVTNEEGTPGNTSNTVTISTPASGSLIVTGIAGDKHIGADFAVPSGFTVIGTLYLSANVSRGFAYKISSGAETSVVWTYGGAGATGDNTCAWVGVYTGNTTTPLDASAEADSGVTAVASQSTGTTGTTAQADELAIAIAVVDSTGSVGVPSWDNSFVIIGTDYFGSNAGITIAEKALSATGTVTATATAASGTDQMAAAVATFRSGTTASAGHASGTGAAYSASVASVNPAATVAVNVDWANTGTFGSTSYDDVHPWDGSPLRISRGASATFGGEAMSSCEFVLDNINDQYTPDRQWCDNPSFEQGTAGWQTYAIASLTAAATSITQVTDNALSTSGTKAGEAVLTATNNSGVHLRIPGRFRNGIAYQFGFYLKSMAGNLNVRAGMASSGTPADIASTGSNITTSWAQYTGTFTPTADRTDVVVFVRTTTAATATVRIDAIQVNPGATLRTFIEAPSKGQLVPGRPVQVIATYGGTAYPKFYGFIEQIKPNHEDFTVTITCYDTLRRMSETDVVVPAHSFVSRSGRDLRIAVLEDFERGTRNLVANPSLETDTTGYSVSAGTFTRITTDAAPGAGTCSGEFAASATNQSLTYICYLAPRYFASQVYRASMTVWTTAGTSDWTLGLYTDATTQIASKTITATTTKTRVTITYTLPTEVPANSTATPPGVALTVLLKSQGANTVRIDAVAVTRGPALHPYADTGTGRWPNFIGNGSFDGAALNGWYDTWTNRCTNGSFEVDAAGWTGVTRLTTAAKFGTGHGEILAATPGVFALSGTFASGVTYDLMIWARAAAGTTNFVAAYIGSAGTPGDRSATFSDSVGTTYTKINVTWTPSADRTDAEIRLPVAGTMYIDGVMVTRRDNAISNPIASYADTGPGGGGSFVTSRTTTTTQAKYGARSQEFVTPATAGAGRLYDLNHVGSVLQSGQAFILSLWVRPSSNMPYKVGISANSGAGAFDEATTTGTATANVWTQITRTFTPSAGRTSAAVMDLVAFVQQTDATARTVHLDGVRLIPGSTADDFEMSHWSLGATGEASDIYLTSASMSGTALGALEDLNNLTGTRHWIIPTATGYTYKAEDRAAFAAKSSSKAFDNTVQGLDALDIDRASIINVVPVTYNGGTEYYGDEDSVGSGTGPGYGPRPTSTVGGAAYFPDRTIPDSLGPALVARNAIPRARPTLTLVNLWPDQLERELNDVITVSVTRYLIGTSDEWVIVREDLDIEDAGLRWTTTWALEAYPH